MLEKQVSLKHGVSENGNLQVYYVTKIMEDGKEISSNMSPAMTPKDVNNMNGFDQRSRDIVSAITTPEAKADFEAEKQEKKGIGIEKIISYDRTIDELGRISVRQITRIFDDGKKGDKKYHRSWIMPGDDFSKADAMSKALAKKLHTPEVIKKYKDHQKKQELLRQTLVPVQETMAMADFSSPMLMGVLVVSGLRMIKRKLKEIR